MPERPKQKKPYRPPRVRSERVRPPDMFASGLIREPGGEPEREPQPEP